MVVLTLALRFLCVDVQSLTNTAAGTSQKATQLDIPVGYQRGSRRSGDGHAGGVGGTRNAGANSGCT
jgi:hypothetical protein